MKTSKKTLVLGASEDPERYANKAIRFLQQKGHEIVALGRKKGTAYGISIETETIAIADLHTVTLYLNPLHQQSYYQYILFLKPQRVIFNPGTENEEFQQQLDSAGIPYMEACTLVLLNSGQY
jgi:hypothetical protein